MMFKWIGGSRQLSQGCTLLPFKVDWGQGISEGNLTYMKGHVLLGKGKILMFGTLLLFFFWGGGHRVPFTAGQYL